jgi:phthiocerol/phenolphthiocerol synthesis type-I polyketide synthase E
VGETGRLRERVQRVYRADLDEALLTALTRAVAAWGEGRLPIDVVADGRMVFDGLDPAHTVGCFEVSYPLILDVHGQADLAEAVNQVKERIRRVPRGGIAYGLLHHGSGSGGAEIAYHGCGGLLEEAALLAPPAGPGLGRHRLQGHRLAIRSLILRGQLHLECTYDEGAWREATIAQLVERMAEVLRALATDAAEPSIGFTPADFPLADLDATQLGALAALIDKADQSGE